MEKRRYQRSKTRKTEREIVVLVTLKYDPSDYSPRAVERLVDDKLTDGLPFIIEDVSVRTLSKDEIEKLNTDEDPPPRTVERRAIPIDFGQCDDCAQPADVRYSESGSGKRVAAFCLRHDSTFRRETAKQGRRLFGGTRESAKR